jgi:glycerol dehydrogenase
VGSYAGKLGTDVLVIADTAVWELVGDRVRASFDDTDARLLHAEFGGECSYTEIDRLAGVVADEGATVVVGVGGGKTLDAAKAVGVKHIVKLSVWKASPS